MGKRMSVIEVDSGHVYKNMTEAEKALGLSLGSISTAVKEGKAVKGHRFELIDPSEVVDANTSVEAGKVFIPSDMSLEMSEEEKQKFVKHCTDLGFKCELIEGSVMFLEVRGSDTERVRSLIHESNYNSCWGMTGYDRDQLLNHIKSHK